MRDIEFLDPQVDAEPAAWAAFMREHGLPAYWAYDLLATASGDSRSPATVAMLRDEKGVCGIVCAVITGLRGPGSRVRYPRIGLVDVRLLGSRDTAWHFADRVDLETRRAFLRDFEQAAYRRFGPGMRGVLYRAAPAQALPMLAGRTRPARESMANTAATLSYASLDEWLASLTKSRRADLRRQARIVREDPDLVVRFGFRRDDLDPAELAALLHRHKRRRDTRPWYLRPRPLTEEYFARALAREDVGILTYHDGQGRLLAYGTLFDCGAWPVIGWWAALPPEEGGRKHVYFDHYMRFFGWAIEHGRRGIMAGRASVALKSTLGFAAVPMYLIAAPRGLR